MQNDKGERLLGGQRLVLADHGVRLIVVTGNLIEGTNTPKLLERAAPGTTDQRHSEVGTLPIAQDMGIAIESAAANASLPSGPTVDVGGALNSPPR